MGRPTVYSAGLAGPVLGLLGCLVGPVGGSAQQSRAARPPAVLVFDGVTVVDVEHGGVLPARRVVIAGNRIRTVGAARAVALPPGARVVDARGRYLMPGLWNMHVHLDRQDSAFVRDEGVFLANGVTGLRDAGTAVPLDRLVQLRREILAGTRAGPPRQLFSGRNFNEVKECFDSTGKRWDGVDMICVADTADARHVADSLADAGADMLKPRDVSKAVYVVIADVARRRGVPFGGHADGRSQPEDWRRYIAGGADHLHDAVTPLEASALGARLIDHDWGGEDCQVLPARKWDARLSGKDSADFWNSAGRAVVRRLMQSRYHDSPANLARCRREARQFRRNDTWFVPTLMTMGPFRGVAADSVAARFNARMQEVRSGAPLAGNWLRASGRAAPGSAVPAAPVQDAVMSLAERLGFPILAGTDLGALDDRFGIHAELAGLVAEGLSPANALRSATLNPARMLHATDSLGTVAAGKLADLVLLDANPLADITNTTAVRAVVADGRYYDRAALDTLLRAPRGRGPR